jgi:hypothetical protein
MGDKEERFSCSGDAFWERGHLARLPQNRRDTCVPRVVPRQTETVATNIAVDTAIPSAVEYESISPVC